MIAEKERIEERLKQLKGLVTERMQQGQFADAQRAHAELVTLENRYYILFGARIGTKRRSVNF